MADFATLAALKAALDITDNSRDAMLSVLNGSATQMLIDAMERDPRVDDFVEKASGLGTNTLLVNQYPILDVASIKIDGPPGSDPWPVPKGYFDWDSYSIWRKDGGTFARGRRNVTVSYSAGLDPLPKTLSLAAIYTVRALITSRKVDLNASGESWQGVNSAAWSAQGPGTVPQAALTLIERFTRTISV